MWPLHKVHSGKKGEINGYLEKAKCGHFTKLTAANKGPNKWLP
jgi:hypothetical protein